MPTTTSGTLTSSLAPAGFEDEVTFTVVITGSIFTVASPSGNVDFYDNGNLIASIALVSNGPVDPSSTATLGPITILLVGIHNIVAVYGGDANYSGCTAVPNPLVEQINTTVSLASQISGFALIASFSSTGDASLPPQATLFAVPAATTAHTSITLLWNTINVGQIEITGNNGFDPAFDTGRISTTGSGVYIVGSGFVKSILLTLTAYNATGVPLGLTSTAQITIS